MKLLLGGSPCTHWSIAKTQNRETAPEGIGWELFWNYPIAIKKYHPDYFLYENNKSMALAIREQITRELGVEPILINSALVSAQNRQRLYWTNIPGITQPEDRGILLRDILESGVCWREKGYTLRASHAHGGTSSVLKTIKEPGKFSLNGVAEPVRIGSIEHGGKSDGPDGQGYRVYSVDGKSKTLCGNGGGGGAKTGLYAVPNDCPALRVAEATTKGYVDILPGECVDLTMPNSKTRRGRAMLEKSNCLTTSCQYYQYCGTQDKPIYEVRNGQITIREQQYPIKLIDGFYIIRKLTVTECKRLQTVPDDYVFPVSNTQAYKMLGNGWTVDVIAHILSYCPGIAAEPVEVLSMYDGMSCGHIALDKLGAKVTRYFATEIDKYAIRTTQHNFPETIQLGDAFQVRDAAWNIF